MIAVTAAGAGHPGTRLGLGARARQSSSESLCSGFRAQLRHRASLSDHASRSPASREEENENLKRKMIIWRTLVTFAGPGGGGRPRRRAGLPARPPAHSSRVKVTPSHECF